MEWVKMDRERLLKRLDAPEGLVDIVLDTDTFNEVDDQFALSYAMLSPERLNVEAVYAAPFLNERSSDPGDGMEKSFCEITRLLEKIKRYPAGGVFKGARRFLADGETPADSPAARDLVARAMARPEDSPLYVVAIGAITNVASALLLQPRVAEKIVVVWLGGHAFGYPDAKEFNLDQDKPAARVVFDSGAPVVLIPCKGVASHMLTTRLELMDALGGKNELCDALVELFSAYSTEHFGWAKEIWDLAAVAWLVRPECVPGHIAPSPLISEDAHWAFDPTRHPIRVADYVYRNPIFIDAFKKLAGTE